MGVSLWFLAATIVFLVNLTVTVWPCVKHGLRGGFGTVQDGSCERTKNLRAWLHLTINGLSTILLGASNCCMQCISSPTREEVDRSHIQGIRVDIGYQAFEM